MEEYKNLVEGIKSFCKKGFPPHRTINISHTPQLKAGMKKCDMDFHSHL